MMGGKGAEREGQQPLGGGSGEGRKEGRKEGVEGRRAALLRVPATGTSLASEVQGLRVYVCASVRVRAEPRGPPTSPPGLAWPAPMPSGTLRRRVTELKINNREISPGSGAVGGVGCDQNF